MVVIGDYPDSRQLRGVKGLAVIQQVTALKVRYCIKFDIGFIPLYAELNSKGNWWAALGYPEASSPLWGF
jgi:hypothetical protein